MIHFKSIYHPSSINNFVHACTVITYKVWNHIYGGNNEAKRATPLSAQLSLYHYI